MPEILMNELLLGKPTVIKGKEYNSTAQYVEPFINEMTKYTDDFKVDIKLPGQMTLGVDAADVTYNRVLIQAKLPESHCIDNHDEVIGFLYGLDVRKPVVKIFRSMENRACTNMCVFDPQWIQVQELISGEPINYAGIRNLMEMTSDFKVKLDKTKSNFVSRSERKEQLGYWVDATLREHEDYGYGKVKVATSAPISAYKNLFIDQESEYYIPEGHDPSQFDILNAFTQEVTNGRKTDIMNMFEKTLIINRILGIG